jgi:hypothetical protein
MPTLQSGQSAGQRLKAAQRVLERAKNAVVTAVKKRVDALRSVTRQYDAAHALARKANERLTAQERLVGEADDRQDAAVEALAQARIGAGASRGKPFGDLGAPSVSDIQKMDTIKEAQLLTKLATRLLKSPDPRVRKAATAAKKAAADVLAAAKPLGQLRKNRNAAQDARDAIGPRWEKAFAALKRGAKAAEDEGAQDLHRTLFEVEAPTRSKKKSTSKKSATKKSADADAGGASPSSNGGGSLADFDSDSDSDSA